MLIPAAFLLHFLLVSTETLVYFHIHRPVIIPGYDRHAQAATYTHFLRCDD
jgi:hypothetical protein